MSQQEFYETVMKREEFEMEQQSYTEMSNILDSQHAAKFKQTYELNVNGKTEQREGLTYLSWAWAWAEFKKIYPRASYEVVKSDLGLPYFESDAGAMVYTKVWADNVEHEMWLPVMNGANKAMKKEPYTYKTKFGDKSVEAYTMFDVNKTIMRCLVKNLAMFGLGLYIYAGDDLPDVEFDVMPLVEKLYASKTLDELKTVYAEVLAACGNNQEAKKAVISATNTKKAELSKSSEGA